MTIISGGIFGEGFDLDKPRPAPVEEPPVIWTDDGLVIADRYAANVIIPERSTLH